MLRKIFSAAAVTASVAAMAPSAAVAQDWGHGGGYAQGAYGGGHGGGWTGRARHDGDGYRGRPGHGQRWNQTSGNAHYAGNGYYHSRPTVRWGGHSRGHGNGYYRH